MQDQDEQSTARGPAIIPLSSLHGHGRIESNESLFTFIHCSRHDESMAVTSSSPPRPRPRLPTHTTPPLPSPSFPPRFHPPRGTRDRDSSPSHRGRPDSPAADQFHHSVPRFSFRNNCCVSPTPYFESIPSSRGRGRVQSTTAGFGSFRAIPPAKAVWSTD